VNDNLWILIFAGLVAGLFFGFLIGDVTARSEERAHWCRMVHERLVDFESCQKTPDWKEGEAE
jgi:uncharacterized membrane-anchored protein YhcB (DUF1043 family)